MTKKPSKQIDKKNNKIRKRKVARKIDVVFCLFFLGLLLVNFFTRFVELRTDNYDGKKLLFEILRLSIVELMYISGLVYGLLRYKSARRKIFCAFGCIGNGVLIALYNFYYFDACGLILLLYNLVLILGHLFKYFTEIAKYGKSKCLKLGILMWIMLLYPCIVISVKPPYREVLNQSLLFIYIAIFAGVLSIIFIILSFTAYKNCYKVLAKQIYVKILYGVAVLLLIFIGSYMVVDTANSAVCTKNYTVACEIVDKRIDSRVAGRGVSITFYNISIDFNGQVYELGVSRYTYIEKEKGQTLVVKYCTGVLNIPYIVSLE